MASSLPGDVIAKILTSLVTFPWHLLLHRVSYGFYWSPALISQWLAYPG